MKPDLIQIAYEVSSLASMVTSRTCIARHINAVHGTTYVAKDIEKIIAGAKPATPRVLCESKIKVQDPIAWSPPIATNRSGVDPLAKALALYHAKRTSGAVKAHWEAMAA